jgi:hypothetical protein
VGTSRPALTPFTRAYPGSAVTALTAYWLARTQSLLAFQRSRPYACLRVWFEDLEMAQHQTCIAS